MFKVTTDKKFTREVKIHVPADSGHIIQSLKVTYRVVPEGELSQEVAATHETQKADCRKIIVSLDDMVDEENNAVPYSEELRDQLLEAAYVRLAILNVYVGAVTKVRAGN